jgi:hypothetical protein
LDLPDARNRQAIDLKLAYTEFLALLIGDRNSQARSTAFHHTITPGLTLAQALGHLAIRQGVDS